MNSEDFDSLKRGLAQVEEYRAGARKGFNVHEPIDFKAVRKATAKTQAEFARAYHIPAGTVKDWEQNRRQPDTPAKVLLSLIKADPRRIEQMLASAD